MLWSLLARNHQCFVILFCFPLTANTVFALQDLLRREGSEFGPMVRDPFYVVSAGTRYVYVNVHFVTAGSVLAILLPAAVVMCLCKRMDHDKLEKTSARTQFWVCCVQQG